MNNAHTKKHELKRDGKWIPCWIVCESVQWGYMIVGYAHNGVEYQTRANALCVRPAK